MFNKRLKERVNALEIWVQNISDIQHQLLKELGYKIKYENPAHYKVRIIKKDEDE